MGLELLLGVGLGFVLLGPKRMHELLAQVGKYKAQFDQATKGMKRQLESEFSNTTSAKANPPVET